MPGLTTVKETYFNKKWNDFLNFWKLKFFKFEPNKTIIIPIKFILKLKITEYTTNSTANSICVITRWNNFKTFYILSKVWYNLNWFCSESVWKQFGSVKI